MPPPVSKGLRPADDAALAERMRCGDEAALGALYDLYAATVLGVARRVTGNPRAAREALQETFLWVWTHADHCDPARGTMRSWLAVLTYRRATDWVQAEAARWRRVPNPSSSDLVASGEDRALDEDGVLTERLANWLRSEIGALPAAQRDVVLMQYVEGRPVSDIAAVLGVPEGTATTRLRSARQHLAAHLAAEGLVALP